MQLYVNGRTIHIENYDEYAKDFERTVLPQYAGDAESLLVYALEEQLENDDGVKVHVYELQTEKNEPIDFFFILNENILSFVQSCPGEYI